MHRKVKFKPNTEVTPCPYCNNNTEFVAHSDQIAEDCCEVWVVCACGYDPTANKPGYRFEDVWGGVGDDNVTMAIQVWNDIIIDEPIDDAERYALLGSM